MIERAVKADEYRQLVLAGGVACNQSLRVALAQIAEAQNIPLVLPQPKYCTDNGAMIAFLGEKYLKRGMESPLSLNALARIELGEREK
jgi:N6-L-threonylcarbamoyladenine synthase